MPLSRNIFGDSYIYSHLIEPSLLPMIHSNHNALDHSIFEEEDRFAGSQRGQGAVNRSQPSGGGGGLGGGAGAGNAGTNQGSSGSGSSSNSAAEEEEEEVQETQPQEEPVEENEEETGPFVKLTDAKFVTPEDVSIDEETGVQVSVEYLKTRKPSQIQFEVTATYNGEEEKAPSVTGTVKDGIATAQVPLPMHQGFYNTEGKTDADKIDYTFKAKCEEDETECEGDVVQLPTKQNELTLIEIDSAVFNHENIVPCLDENATLIDSIATAFHHTAHDEPDHELVVYGHATGGLAFTASEQRALGIKAIIKDDSSAWKQLCVGYGSSKDYQQSLKVLSDSYGWDCDPGAVDGAPGAKTIAGVLGFQRTYNATYNKRIKVDGDWGGISWIALMKTIRHLAVYLSQVEESRINTEFYSKVDGVLPCADTFPKASTGAEGYTSSSEDRVELLYHARPNPPAMAKTSEGQVSTQEAGAYEQALCDIEVVGYDGLSTSGLNKVENVVAWVEDDSGNKRISSQGELHIVPTSSTKKVFFKAQTAAKGQSITVDLEGDDSSHFKRKAISPAGNTGSEDIPTAGFMKWDKLLPLSGELEPLLTPKVIDAKASLQGGNSKEVQVFVWPNNEESIEWNLAKSFKWFKTMAKTIPGAISWLPGAEVEFTALVGKIEAKGAFNEDPSSHEVYYAFSVNGGFKPLIAAKVTLSISAWNLVGLPDKLMKYAADLKGGVEFEGKITYTMELARTGIDDYKGSGGIAGSIGVNFFIACLIGNGKVLEAKVAIGSGVEAKSRLGIEAKDRCKKWDMELNSELELGALKGEVSWTVFDGMWSSKNTCTFYEGKKWTADPIKLF